MFKMEKSAILFVTALIAVVAAVLVLSAQQAAAPDGAFEPSPPATLEEKTTVVDGITIRAQPETLPNGNLQFRVELTTHSGDLSSYDAGKNVFLRSDGIDVLSLRAENAAGEGPSGHHRRLSLEFPAPAAAHLTLVFRDLDGGGAKEITWP